MNYLKIHWIILLLGIVTTFSATTYHAPATTAASPQSIDDSLLTTAQTFNQQGADDLAAGQPTLALEQWQQAHKIYTTLKDQAGIIGTEINQAQAFQALGYYRQALVSLRIVQARLQPASNSPLKVRALLSLGNTLISLRLLEVKPGNTASRNDWGAKEILKEALIMAIDLHDPVAADQIRLSLGNTLQLIHAQQKNSGHSSEKLPKDAIAQYQAVRDSSTSPLLRIQAQVNLYRLESLPHQQLNSLIVLKTIRKDLDALPPTHSTVHVYVNLAKIIQGNQPDHFSNGELLTQTGELLTMAIGQARSIKDFRGEAQALGTLGSLYHFTGQHKYAQKLTTQALVIAEGLPAPDIAYRLQWQLGRILTVNNPNDVTAAITAYRQAIGHLKTLRNDLNASDADLQFSFRDSVEPVYRELVGLLLKDGHQILAANLTIARDLIESLQVAELEDFLRQGCLDTYTVQLDKIDRSAAIIYPIILPDRVAVITAIPQQPLRYHSRPISKTEFEATISKLRADLSINPEFYEPAFQQRSQRIYDLLIAPLAADLQRSHTKTLVFVLDGELRSIPMSILYDGKNYLVEKYNLALTPGLQLVPPGNAAGNHPYQAFLGGISEARQGYAALPNVKTELESISKLMPSQQLLNAQFNQSRAVTDLVANSSSIVHLATHGEFSANPADTFILTWDGRLDLHQLNNLLQNRNIQSGKTIDLLVLSACKTATGDNRNLLGLAGVAVRAGTKSTIASLWQIDDESTQLLMTSLYQNLVIQKLGKAASLSIAQQTLLRNSNPKYRSPYYWASFVLIGNWQ